MQEAVWGGCQPQPWHNDVILKKLLKYYIFKSFYNVQSWALDTVPTSTNTMQQPLLHKLFCQGVLGWMANLKQTGKVKWSMPSWGNKW